MKSDTDSNRIPALMKFSDGRSVCSKEDWAERRQEIKKMLTDCEYGTMPDAPKEVRTKWAAYDENALAGKAVWLKAEIEFDTPGGRCRIPFDLMLPKSQEKVPAFVFLSFEDSVPNKYYPAEEIADSGYAVAMLHYEKVAGDSVETAGNGIKEVYGSDYIWGTLAIWAFAASRVADALCERAEIDTARLTVIGHSRLGKAALLAGAFDDRFWCTVSNDSGCSGAALSRGKQGERIENIVKNFPYWFCPDYENYAGREEELPFDQHFLLALAAPRLLYVASAAKDLWADPAAEYRGALLASEAYSFMGLKGLEDVRKSDDGAPEVGTMLHEGRLGYHLRDGMHYLSREDWKKVIGFLKKQASEFY